MSQSYAAVKEMCFAQPIFYLQKYMLFMVCNCIKLCKNKLLQLPMFPVRLRHAADHLAEHEYPIHLIFFDRVPGCIALVI